MEHARHARRGNLDARLMTDRRLREDPFASYDEVRSRGPLSRGPFAWTSASHEVCGSVHLFHLHPADRISLFLLEILRRVRVELALAACAAEIPLRR